MILKGSIYFFSVFLSFFILASLAEYFFEFSTFWRATIFFLFVLFNTILLIRYIGFPAYKLFGGKGRMTNEKAAHEIGKLIPEISDKLLNTLQLKSANIQNYDLILASLEKRSKSLLIHKFSSSIQFRNNRDKLKYFLVPITVIVLLVVWDTNILLKSTERLLNYQDEYVKQAPFDFHLKNKELVVLQGESITIDLELSGEDFPGIVKIDSDFGRYSMLKAQQNQFSHEFKNVNNSFVFSFEGNGYKSREYRVIVIPKPRINEMKIELKYPKYLNRENDIVVDNGDLIIPEGTKLNYKLRLENINQYKFEFRLIKEQR